MKFKGLLVDPESKVEPIASLWVPHVEVLSWGVFIQMSVVLSKFFLGIDILQHLCGFPPLWICLNHYGFRFYFLNEFLCSLCKHCWHVTTSNKENFFATESLGEMNESAFEAIDSITFTVSIWCSCWVSGSNEDVSWNSCSIIRTLHRCVESSIST